MSRRPPDPRFDERLSPEERRDARARDRARKRPRREQFRAWASRLLSLSDLDDPRTEPANGGSDTVPK